MNAKIKYTNEPLGNITVIPDFLPLITELDFKEEAIEVTLSMSKKSLEFFKSEAAKNHTPYQDAIRQFLETYADSHSQNYLAP